MSLTAKVDDLTQTNAAAKAEIDRLTSIIKTLRRDRFGKRSEKLGDDEADQQSFVFEEIETELAAIATRLEAKADPKPRKASPDKPRFPSHLERVEVILEPEIPPEFEGKERVRIGQEESVRLYVVRARFRLIVTIRPKYAYKEPAAILQAPAPEHIVEAGLPTEALLAQIAVSKYANSDEAGHAFQYEAGHLFRSEAGQRSDLKPATCSLPPQVRIDDVALFLIGQERMDFGRTSASCASSRRPDRSGRRCE